MLYRLTILLNINLVSISGRGVEPLRVSAVQGLVSTTKAFIGRDKPLVKANGEVGEIFHSISQKGRLAPQ